MADTKVQRIRLRCEGSPVKFDATIIATSRDGKEIKVQFDAPMEDTIMVSIGDKRMASDMLDRDGATTHDWRFAVKSLVWEVL